LILLVMNESGCFGKVQHDSICALRAIGL